MSVNSISYFGVYCKLICMVSHCTCSSFLTPYGVSFLFPGYLLSTHPQLPTPPCGPPGWAHLHSLVSRSLLFPELGRGASLPLLALASTSSALSSNSDLHFFFVFTTTQSNLTTSYQLWIYDRETLSRIFSFQTEWLPPSSNGKVVLIISEYLIASFRVTCKEITFVLFP